MRVMDRDKERLKFINGFGCVITEQIAKQDNVGYRNAARRVQAMCEAGLVERVELAISSKSPIVCTKLGCSVADDTLPPLAGIRLGTLQHDLRLVDIARALTSRLGGVFEPARRVAQRREEWQLNHLPDGVLHLPHRKPIFIELELSLKAPKRLKAIIDGYGANLGIAEVWYLVEDAAIGRAVQKIADAYSHIKVVGVTPKAAANAGAPQ